MTVNLFYVAFAMLGWGCVSIIKNSRSSIMELGALLLAFPVMKEYSETPYYCAILTSTMLGAATNLVISTWSLVRNK